MTGAFSVPVRDSIAWVVLTDYDHIGRFVDSVKASKITSRESGHVMLRQEAVGGFLFLRRRVHVLLDIREVPTRRITFRDVLGRDFESYAGEWRVTSEPGGTHVDYQLAAEPRAAIPKSVCRGMLRHMAQGLLEQVRAEMIRRAQ